MPSEGFVVSHAIISDQAGHTLLDVPDIAAPAADSLPLWSSMPTW